MSARGSARSSWVVLAAGAATVGLGAALSLGWEPGIRGQWIWRRNDLPVHLEWMLAAGVVLVAVVAALCRRGRWGRMSAARRAGGLILLVAAAFAFQVAALNAIRPSWITPGAYIASPNATTYFAVALDVRDARAWVSDYHTLMEALPHHAATHPPGKVLFFHLVRWATGALDAAPPAPIGVALIQVGDDLGLRLAPTDAAAAIASALLISLAGALGLVPLYLLAQRLAGEAAAIHAACLAATMPGLLLLGASPDLIALALTISTLALAYAAWRAGGLMRWLLVGLLLAAGLFFSLAFTLVGAWALAWALVGWARAQDREAVLRRAAGAGAAVLAGTAGTYAILYALTGYRPIAVAVQALFAHRHVTTIEAARSYWAWLLMNPVECMVFAGAPLTVAAIRSRFALRSPDKGQLAGFLLSWIAVFAALILSGTVRGEVGRIWLFLFWPGAIAGGARLAGEPDGGRITVFLAAFQVIQALLMKSYLTLYSIL